jgi:hypothetical protein
MLSALVSHEYHNLAEVGWHAKVVDEMKLLLRQMRMPKQRTDSEADQIALS